MRKSNRWIALFTILAMCVMMLASCAGGRTYEDVAGSLSSVTVEGKDEVVEVPYTGEPIVEYIEIEGDIIEIEASDDDSDDGDDDSDDGDDGENAGNSSNNGNGSNGGGTDNGGENSGNGENSGSGDDADDPFADEDDEFELDLPNYIEADVLRILSQNVRCVSDADKVPGTTLEQRHLRIKDEVETVNPDLIGFQEVRPVWINYLIADLGADYDYYYCFRASGSTTADSGDECSAVFWKKDRFERLDAGEFWLSPTPDKVSKFPVATDQHRICNWVKLKNKETGKQFIFGSVHYSTDAEPRLLSADVMNTQLKKISGGKLPIICVGDYNMTPYSEPYNALLQGGLLGDLNWELAAMGWNDGVMDNHTTGGGYNSQFDENGEVVKGGQIDFIMISYAETGLYPKSYKVLQQKYGGSYVDPGYVSDHFGVLGEVVIPSVKNR